MLARHLCRVGKTVTILYSLAAVACTSNPAPHVPVRSLGAHSPMEVLPADLDVVIWLDIARLRGLWTMQPDRQIATILGEYGAFAATPRANEAGFWLHLLEQSDRWWIACRPTRNGCLDAVVFARGQFERHDPALVLADLTRPIDLGAGWYRYDRRARVDRHQAARIYLAPPDRTVVVTPAELDAVEVSLEKGRGEPALRVEERGLFSMTMRARAIARLFEQRAPAAARFLRDAGVIKMWLDVTPADLRLTVSIGFASPERAERARRAFAQIASAVGALNPSTATEPIATEVVENEFLLRLYITPKPSPNDQPSRSTKPRDVAEPAAQ